MSSPTSCRSGRTYDPATDADAVLRPERVAAARILRTSPKLAVPPTVSEEIERTADPTERAALVGWRDALPLQFLECPAGAVAARAQEFRQYHDHERDCRIVAEAEVGGVAVFLTFDRTLRNRLGDRSPTVRVRYPTEYWGELQSSGGRVRAEPSS